MSCDTKQEREVDGHQSSSTTQPSRERESQGGDCRINLDNYAANRGNIVEEEEEESPFRIADIITANDNDDDV